MGLQDKEESDGTVERFKARLVAKGFDQQSGVDYTETFSPVIKPSTIRIILAVAVQSEWDIRQLDVSNAFLHGNLLEEVYMEQPQGFAAKGQPDLVCKLHKAIYGLKQAPRAWFTRLSNFLLDLGFTASLVDTSLFIYICGSIQIYMLVYVDDIIITGTHSSVISSLIVKLQCEFPVKDLGPLNFFLGIQVTRTSHGLHLCQSKYIFDLLCRTHMEHAKPARSPCSSGRLDPSSLSLMGNCYLILQPIDKLWGHSNIVLLLDQKLHFLLINSVNTCILLHPHIGQPQREFCGILKGHLIMVSIILKAIFSLMPSAILIGQDALMIADPLLALLYFWVIA
jgi:hypothetical protein